jgi:hypothetical protein
VVEEVRNLKKNYGFEIDDYQCVAILDAAELPRKAFVGTPWFSILSNPEYADAFAFVGAHVSEREKLLGNAYYENGDVTCVE